MPSSVLRENELTTSVASPAVASWFLRSCFPVMVWMPGHSSCDANTSRQQSASVTLRVAWGHGLGGGICKTQNPVPRDRITLDVKCGILKKKVFLLQIMSNT